VAAVRRRERGRPRHGLGGENYLAVCERSDDPEAAAVAEGLRVILEGPDEQFQLEYPCHAPDQQRWFPSGRRGSATPATTTSGCLTPTSPGGNWPSQEARARTNQLETILGVLAHDIRNPLNVIDGYAELLEREVEDPGAVESIREATARIIEITGTTLRFIRSGGLTEMEPVAVVALAEEAWGTVPTPAATLETVGSRTVHGDRMLLRQLLENLYRNAVEHAGKDCTVTVGSLSDGFYVEDDGPGLPPEVRARAEKADFSTRGVGLGLSIVQAVADAHGATLRVTESAAGGARFEVRDVDLAP
jgi:signal transduction histidine kinase